MASDNQAERHFGLLLITVVIGIYGQHTDRDGLVRRIAAVQQVRCLLVVVAIYGCVSLVDLSLMRATIGRFSFRPQEWVSAPILRRATG
jgi:hypothetical protein